MKKDRFSLSLYSAYSSLIQRTNPHTSAHDHRTFDRTTLYRHLATSSFLSMATSTLGKILPLIICAILLCIIGAVGYVAYLIATDVADKTSKKMEKKNMSFSRDGMKVGVKEISAEQVGDSTQRYGRHCLNESFETTTNPKLVFL